MDDWIVGNDKIGAGVAIGIDFRFLNHKVEDPEPTGLGGAKTQSFKIFKTPRH
jgi:hypothetical protein